MRRPPWYIPAATSPGTATTPSASGPSPSSMPCSGSWGRKGGFYIQEKVSLPKYPAPESARGRRLEGEGPAAVSTGAGRRQPGGDRGLHRTGRLSSKVSSSTRPICRIRCPTSPSSLQPGGGQPGPGGGDRHPARGDDRLCGRGPAGVHLSGTLRRSAQRTGTRAVAWHCGRRPSSPHHETRPAWWMASELAERLDLGDFFPVAGLQRGARLAAAAGGQFPGGDAAHRRQDAFRAQTPLYFADGRGTPLQYAEWQDRAVFSDAGRLRPSTPCRAIRPPETPPEGYYRLIYGRAPAHTFGRTTNNPLLFELMPENAVWVNPRTARSSWAEQRRLCAPEESAGRA